MTSRKQNSTSTGRLLRRPLVVKSLEGLCGPHLWVLNEISSALYELHVA